jgi:hypothetical protein
MRAREAAEVAQEVDEQHPGVDVVLSGIAVDAESDGNGH